MQYNLSIRDHNVKAHLDIENDVQRKKNGLFTFVLRINNGNIVDYAVIEYVNVQQKYVGVGEITIAQFTVACDNRV